MLLLIWESGRYSSAPWFIPFEWHHGARAFVLIHPHPACSTIFTQGGSVAKAILMDEFHVTVYALPRLAPPAYDAIRQALDDPRFKADLRRAVRTAFWKQLLPDQVRVTVTQ